MSPRLESLFARACCLLLLVGLNVSVAIAAEESERTGTISFCANLSPDEESAPTESPAVGQAMFTLQRADLKFAWDVKFEKLTGPMIAANLHAPQRPGANAPVLFPLGSDRQAGSPIEGALTLDDGQLKYLLNGRMYVNITTRKYPAGELRGQVLRLLPGATCADLK